MTFMKHVDRLASRKIERFVDRELERQSEDLLAAMVDDPTVVAGILDTIDLDLLVAIENLILRVSLQAFHRHRASIGLDIDPTSSVALHDFWDQLVDDEFCDAIIDEYPVLVERAKLVINNRVHAWNCFASDLSDDLEQMRNQGLIGAEATLAGVAASGGDPHNGGRSVIDCTFSDGSRVLYKPRSLAGDTFAAELFRRLEPETRLSLSGCVPPTLDCGDRGWQCFITPDSMQEGEADAYHYRYGLLCAVMGAIGASDLHHENVIAHGAFPVIVDAETLMTPDRFGSVDGLMEELQTSIAYTPATALLLPADQGGTVIDVNLAGLGVAEKQESSRKSVVLVDAESDAVRLEWKPIVIDPVEANLPNVGGTVVSPVPYLGALTQGLLDGLRLIRNGAVEAALDELPAFPVRYVMRPTFIYMRFLDASTHPDYLGSWDAITGLFSKLSLPLSCPPHAAALIRDEEIRSLMEGDVPYCGGWSDTAEISINGRTFDDGFPGAPIANARRGLAMAASMPNAWHRMIMELCLNELRATDDLVDPPATSSSVFASLCKGSVGDVWPAVAKFLVDTAVVADSELGAECAWVVGTEGSKTLSTVETIGFHDAGGIVAFLRRAALSDHVLAPVAEDAARGLRRLIRPDHMLYQYKGGHPLTVNPPSAATGVPSLLLSLGELDELWLAELMKTLDAGNDSASGFRDLIGGWAGAAMLACADADLIDHLGRERLEALVTYIGTDMEDPALQERPWFDLAHGQLGSMWALARLARVLGDHGLADNSAGWLVERLRHDVLPESNAWCAGNAGLLLAGAEIARISGRGEVMVLLASMGVVGRACRLNADPGPIDISVCHGTSGTVQSLIAASVLLDNSALMAAACELHRSTVEHAARFGAATGTPEIAGYCGYLLGWAGYADTDLLVDRLLHGLPVIGLPAALIPAGVDPQEVLNPAPTRQFATICTGGAS